MTNKQIKIIVLGKVGAGKTSLLITYTTNEFPSGWVPTVFDNYLFTETIYEGDKEIDGKYELGLWDTGGGEDYDRLRPLSYPQTDVFLLCFPVDRRDMFEDVRSYWKPEIRHHMPNTPFVVVATKTDLRTNPKESKTGEPAEEREPIEGDNAKGLIMKEEGLKEAEALGAADYVECSSLLGEGLVDVFRAAIKAAIRFPTVDSKKKKCTLL